MGHKTRRALSLLTVFIALTTLSVWALAVIRQDGQEPRQDGGAQKKLRDLARERDVEVAFHTDSETEYTDLRALAKDADAVVMGRITQAESSFEGDDFIVTRYQVEVKRVLKDVSPGVTCAATEVGGPEAAPAPLTTPLKLARLGGTVNVDGHRATAKVKGHESLTAGRDYVFFLWWGPNSKAYRLAGGISGAVLIEDDLRLKPLASDEALKGRYEGASLDEFIRDVIHE